MPEYSYHHITGVTRRSFGAFTSLGPQVLLGVDIILTMFLGPHVPDNTTFVSISDIRL